ncbi:MAG TPA: PIN domain-containing protein [Terriglobales bacterium]|nr:PIN domain-containing protein [Terriglobales bacterium]
MSGRDFLDTNVLVYAYNSSALNKQRMARQLVARAVVGEFVISTQVLAEFASTLLHKLQPALSVEEVKVALDALAPIFVISPDGDTVRRAVEARAAFGVHFYDGMIIAAAEQAGSKRIWSEDLNLGQEYFGVTVANPFL